MAAMVEGEHTAVDEVEERPQRRREWSGGLRSVVLPLGILAAIVGGLWYWQNAGSAPANDDAYGIVDLPEAKNATGRAPSPEQGRAGPDFVLETPDGGTVRLSDFQGSPVLINFWASWCSPCKDEIPELVEAYDRYRDAGLVIVGVNLQEPDGAVRDFAQDFGMTFPLAIDRDGEVGDAWRLGGPVEGIPTSYFVDEAGVVRDFVYGPMTAELLDQKLAGIVPEEAAA
jgi:peroxiredoxin